MYSLRHLFLTACLAFTLSVLGACSKSGSPTGPEGGLESFVTALASADSRAVYACLSPDTQALFDDALEALRETRETIQSLQPSDQIDARERTRVELLSRLESGADLFEHLSNLSAVPLLDPGSSYREGLEPNTSLDVNETHTIIATRSGQQFEMVRDEEGTWRVRAPMYEIAQQALTRIHQNRERVEEAVRLFGTDLEIEDELRLLGLL